MEEEINRRLRLDLKQAGDFKRVHPLPNTGQDIPDDQDAKLVVLGIDYPHGRERDSSAIAFAKELIETRGNSPRIYRNTLVFVAADKTRLQELDEAVRYYLAWESILRQREELDLSPFQVRQAEAQRNSADNAVDVRLPETYQYCWFRPIESSGGSRRQAWVNSRDPIAVRRRKLRSDEFLVTTFAATDCGWI